MEAKSPRSAAGPSVMLFGVGAFTHGMMHVLKAAGARVSAYLTRSYGHYGPALEGAVYEAARHANPCARALTSARAELTAKIDFL